MAQAQTKLQRYEELLRAVLEMMEKQRDGKFIRDPLYVEVQYDGAICDGYCLMDDIEIAIASEDAAIPASNKEQA